MYDLEQITLNILFLIIINYKVKLFWFNGFQVAMALPLEDTWQYLESFLVIIAGGKEMCPARI